MGGKATNRRPRARLDHAQFAVASLALPDSRKLERPLAMATTLAMVLACCLALASVAHGTVDASTVQIAPGVMMPFVSLGHPDDNSTVAEDLAIWFRLGGVGIDTAWMYKNQPQIAAYLKTAAIPRQRYFMTTKILCQNTTEEALAYVYEDLKELELKYVDLLLMHDPCAHDVRGTQATWRALQIARARGLTRAIGVSNFNIGDINAVLAMGGVPPAVNQCRMSVGFHDDATIAHCAAHGITYEAYSPLRHTNLTDSRLLAIAKRVGKSTAQVALRWITQQGCPLATSPGASAAFAKQDLELDSFVLSEEEMRTLSTMSATAARGPVLR